MRDLRQAETARMAERGHDGMRGGRWLSWEHGLYRLELRYEATRAAELGVARQLPASLERCGQLIPCICGERSGRPGLVLIDRYRLIVAPRRLGSDTVTV